MRLCSMVSLILGIALGGCSHRPPAIWEWSEAYGDKPGIGLRFSVSDSATAGTFYLLDPQKPNDLSAAMQVVPLTQPSHFR